MPFDLTWSEPAGLSEGSSSGYVLLIDADDFGRDTLGQILTADGYFVMAASDGGEALERLREGPTPDLILLDLRAPGVAGWRSIRWLRRDPILRDVPVIVVSATDAPPSYGRQAGIVACFEKPIAADALRAEIRRHLPAG